MRDRKVYMKAYWLAHAEHKREYDKTHAEDRKVYKKAWHLAHREESISRNKAWRLARPDYYKAYYLAHKEEARQAERAYKRTPKGKKYTQKRNAIRRQLNFIPLNKPFKGSHAHHIDRERVIYIPKELHISIWHSVLKNRNMDKINTMAVRFLKTYKMTLPNDLPCERFLGIDK